MPRIRTIKPEFWTSEQVVECSPNTRLLFIGLWNFCDDGGVHTASAARVKMQIFPADSFTKDDVQEMIDELIAAGLLQEYEVDGERYWRVSGWKHQRIDQPTYRHPQPSGEVPGQPNRRRTPGETSESVRRTPSECSPPEGKGREKEGKGSKPLVPPVRGHEGDEPYPMDFEDLWQSRPRRQGADNKRKAFKAWRARQREGHSHDEMIEGVRRYRRHLEATGKANTEFVKMTATFLGPDLHFQDDYPIPDDADPGKKGPNIPPELKGTDWAKQEEARWRREHGGSA